jgi:hypothetical protein
MSIPYIYTSLIVNNIYELLKYLKGSILDDKKDFKLLLESLFNADVFITFMFILIISLSFIFQSATENEHSLYAGLGIIFIIIYILSFPIIQIAKLNKSIYSYFNKSDVINTELEKAIDGGVSLTDLSPITFAFFFATFVGNLNNDKNRIFLICLIIILLIILSIIIIGSLGSKSGMDEDGRMLTFYILILVILFFFLLPFFVITASGIDKINFEYIQSLDVFK